MARLRFLWRQVPLIAKVSFVSFVVLIVLILAVSAVFFPDGPIPAYPFIPVGVNQVVIGALILTNYRGTNDALFELQVWLSRGWPSLGPRPSKVLNRVIATGFVMLGLTLVVAAPLLA